MKETQSPLSAKENDLTNEEVRRRDQFLYFMRWTQWTGLPSALAVIIIGYVANLSQLYIWGASTLIMTLSAVVATRTARAGRLNVGVYIFTITLLVAFSPLPLFISGLLPLIATLNIMVILIVGLFASPEMIMRITAIGFVISIFPLLLFERLTPFSPLDVAGLGAFFTLIVFPFTGFLIHLFGNSLRQSLADSRRYASEMERSQTELVARSGELEAATTDLFTRGAELKEANLQLEETVRTSQRRAAMLQASAEVSHAVTQIRDLDELLPQITQLISQHFGFYHAGIFLIDEAGRYAVLRAANSEGGQRMLARRHKLGVGSEGIVGYVTSTGEPRIALEVHFETPELPDTRSEMAAPLRVGDVAGQPRIIGALDVQSTKESAFEEDDISALTTMADQIAIAIQNAHLFQQSQTALEEAQQAQRRFVQQEWSQFTQRQLKLSHEYTLSGVEPLGEAPSPEAREAWHRGELVIANAPGGRAQEAAQPVRATLAAPIKFGDETIGVLDILEMDVERAWTEDEIALVQAVADQLGQALNSARLFEETQRRARREALTRHITERIRSRTEMDAMLQTAIRELAQALGAPRAFVQLAPGALQTETRHVGADKLFGDRADVRPRES